MISLPPSGARAKESEPKLRQADNESVATDPTGGSPSISSRLGGRGRVGRGLFPKVDDGTGSAAGARGPYASLAVAIAIIAAVFVTQAVVIVGYSQALMRLDGTTPDIAALPTDGLLLSLATLASTAVAGGALLLATTAGSRCRELGLRRPAVKSLLLGAAGLIGLALAFAAIAAALGRPAPPELVAKTVRNAGSLPLLAFAVVVAAPLWEELLFRGLLYDGLRRSRSGAWPAVVLPAALWAGIHLQYEPLYVGFILLLGVYLGVLRHCTGSTVVCIAVHALNNLAGLALAYGGAAETLAQRT